MIFFLFSKYFDESNYLTYFQCANWYQSGGTWKMDLPNRPIPLTPASRHLGFYSKNDYWIDYQGFESAMWFKGQPNIIPDPIYGMNFYPPIVNDYTTYNKANVGRRNRLHGILFLLIMLMILL